MNVENLTIGELKKLSGLVNALSGTAEPVPQCGLIGMLGQTCIVRTRSAGVWFGRVDQKAGAEVILTNARRMWRWWAAEGISLSAVAVHGIKRDKSRIAGPVSAVWLEAIEIIPVSEVALESIGGADVAKAA